MASAVHSCGGHGRSSTPKFKMGCSSEQQATWAWTKGKRPTEMQAMPQPQNLPSCRGFLCVCVLCALPSG
jgi:hypothetical protein